MIWFGGLLVLVAFGTGVYWFIRIKVLESQPDGYPTSGQPNAGAPDHATVVVCAGDSITHGNMGVDYVAMLRGSLQAEGYYFFNAGINADLTFTLLRRIDDVVATQPNYVTLLIGANDLNAAVDARALKTYRKLGKLSATETPNFDTFCANYKQIIYRLKTQTNAQIGVCSIPIIGEDLAHQINLNADRYSAFLKDLCAQQQLTYLPVREAMKEYLEHNPKKMGTPYAKTNMLVNMAVLRHYLAGTSWDLISDSVGNALSHDNLHFNTRGAKIIADVTGSFLSASLHESFKIL